MINIFRKLRRAIHDKSTASKKEAKLEGVRVSLANLSPRMRDALLDGWYEGEERRIIRAFVNPDDKILEAGSSIGFISLFCIHNMGVKDIQLLEANPDLAATINENYTLNGRAAPRILQYALGPEDAQIEFGINVDAFASSIHSTSKEIRRVKVQQKTIDSILSEMDFTPNVLIMDIEGAETLLPADHFIKFDRIILELHPSLSGYESVSRLVNGLFELGFRESARDRNVACFSKST
ncbi:FkbM family methyltransferase [Devosia honganensis]|uniref:FkbM family methyltransferase n=1 Tax=Devosia honganensis TaxID=1610527 RepID=A0ABV7WX59_9HYPH